MRGTKILTSVSVSVSLLLFSYTSLFAEVKKGIESQLSIDIGWEQLEYEEHEPDTSLDSKARVNNGVVRIEGLKRWGYIFGGIKAVIPVLLGDDEETWIRSGSTIQTNTLEYGWNRVDAYVGYPLTHWFNPYGGLRWSKGEQDRDAFIVLGTSVTGASREVIRSWSLLLGIRGNGNFTPQWRWNYWLGYFFPIDVEVTNSSLPGFKAIDRDGYTLELKGGVEYSYIEALSFGLLFYGGRMHWNGSGWEPYTGGSAKWPENNTDYLGGSLNISWRF